MVDGCPPTCEPEQPDPPALELCTLSKDCTGTLVCMNGVCQEPPEGNFCTKDSDCSADQVCLNGTCEKPVPCPDTAACPNGLVCVEGECKNPPPCTTDEACSDGQICQNGACSDPDCTQKEDCAGDMICENGRCVPPQCTADGDCAKGQQCVDGKCADIDCALTPTLPYCLCKDSSNEACCLAPTSSEACIEFCVTQPDNCVNDPCPDDEQTDAVCCKIMTSGASSWDGSACVSSVKTCSSTSDCGADEFCTPDIPSAGGYSCAEGDLVDEEMYPCEKQFRKICCPRGTENGVGALDGKCCPKDGVLCDWKMRDDTEHGWTITTYGPCWCV